MSSSRATDKRLRNYELCKRDNNNQKTDVGNVLNIYLFSRYQEREESGKEEIQEGNFEIRVTGFHTHLLSGKLSFSI